MHILVCSSNLLVVNELAQALDQPGHRLTACESGLEILRVVETLQADLLIMDMDMPGLNGLLLVSAVKELAPALSIVGVSAKSAVADARALTQKGVLLVTLAGAGDGDGAARPLLAELAQLGGGGLPVGPVSAGD